MKKIAFFMSGNYSGILQNCPDFLSDFESIAYCPNKLSFDACRTDLRFTNSEYLYEGFNEIFDKSHGDEFISMFPDVNLSRVLMVDKSHYKRKSGSYQKKIINTMGMKLCEWFKREKPDFIFFPIIESIDAMLAYALARKFNAEPIVYAHARHIHCSFYSQSCNETLPEYTKFEGFDDHIRSRASYILSEYKKLCKPLSYDYGADNKESRYIAPPMSNTLKRFARSFRLRYGTEKHNQTLKLLTKFEVYFQKKAVPIRNLKYNLIERFYLKTLASKPLDFDYFPLHFSPESSINTPAPFYIDQERVVDRILLDREGNRPLLLKEHPAMFGFRAFSFYRKLKKKPLVYFLPANFSSIDLVRNAYTVYSVTGTACLEAFFLDKTWVQLGENFLNDWERRFSKETGRIPDPLSFIESVLEVSDDFVLFAPGHSQERDNLLFSKKNVERMCRHLALHISKLQSR